MENLTFPDEFDKILSLDNKPGHLTAAGSIVVFNHQNYNEFAIYRAKTKFCNIESCQLCTPCREGTRVMRESVESLFDGRIPVGSKDWKSLQQVVRSMEVSSNCGHGKAAGKMSRVLMEIISKKSSAESHL